MAKELFGDYKNDKEDFIVIQEEGDKDDITDKTDDPIIDENLTEEEKAAQAAEQEAQDKGEFIEIKEISDVDEDDESDDDDDSDDAKPKGNGKTDDPDSDEESTITLSPFATAFKEQGILPDLDLEGITDETDVAELIIEQMGAEIKKREFSDLSDTQKELLEYMREGGDVNQYLQVHQAQHEAETTYGEITETNAEAFLTDYFKLKGFDDNEITEFIDGFETTGKTLDKAKSFKTGYDKLLKEQKETTVKQAKAQSEAQEKQYKEQLNQFRQAVDSTESLIKGVKLNKQTKDKLYDMIVNPSEKAKDGTPITAFQKTYQEDPMKTEMVINYIHMLTDGFKNLDNISSAKVSKSDAIQDLKDSIEKQKRVGTSGRGTPKKANNNNNNLSPVEALKATFGKK